MQTELAETNTWKTSLFVPRVRALSPSAELTAAVTPSHLQKRTPFRGLHEHESKVYLSKSTWPSSHLCDMSSFKDHQLYLAVYYCLYRLQAAEGCRN